MLFTHLEANCRAGGLITFQENFMNGRGVNKQA